MSFLSLAGDDGFELAPGAIAKAVFGERGMLNVSSCSPAPRCRCTRTRTSSSA